MRKAVTELGVLQTKNENGLICVVVAGFASASGHIGIGDYG
jgi:hypothetical protein